MFVLDENRPDFGSAGRLVSALEALLQARHYASETKSDVWNFAISFDGLLRLGPTETDLRWLVHRGIISHGRAVTNDDRTTREFCSTKALTFYNETCFVLTDAGVSVAYEFLNCPLIGHRLLKPPKLKSTKIMVSHDVCVVPDWDASGRKLFVGGQLVKRYKWPAVNQETVLNVFQEEGWPERIDDPLAPHPQQDPKRRLADTIKCLNRRQATPLVHFRGDGTGQGIIWELKSFAIAN